MTGPDAPASPCDGPGILGNQPGSEGLAVEAESAGGAGVTEPHESASRARDLAPDLARMQQAASVLEEAGQPGLARIVLGWDRLDRASRAAILEVAKGFISPPGEEDAT